MATSKTTATRPAQKKTVERKAASGAPRKTAAKKTAAKKTAKASSGEKKNAVTLYGRPAMNRHFLVEKILVDKAAEKAKSDGVILSDVLRHGVFVYGQDAPTAKQVKPAMSVLPPQGLKALKKVWLSEDSDLRNQYLAALHRGGWTTSAIASSLVEVGVVDTMTRQAVSLRVNRAPDELRDDLPEVPELGPRRPIQSARKGQRGAYVQPEVLARDSRHDLSFRIENEEYAAAKRRAEHEGAMMSVVIDNILASYVAGEYDEIFPGE